jgi:hypothetical protein
MVTASDSGEARGREGAKKSWYDQLGVSSSASADDVAAAIERLSRQATALANTAPDRSQALRETVRSMRRDLQSGVEARSRYDTQLANQAVMWNFSGPSVPGPDLTLSAQSPISLETYISATLKPVARRFRKFLQEGWTCPKCGTDGLPNDRFCQSCGAAMQDPSVQVRDQPLSPAHCSSCGRALRRGDGFCSACGATVT